ncbi:alpha/beta fold hydrolase [Pseudomonas knackmussii]|uniref:alpha/beta fold hydrolase n=1 Tax=Pseudomonas knackmussii TaxID=65741 RepID=UPI001363A2C5|nr:alpha/beta fold hydrolase [Pseudomonas knackmussii]
MRLLTLSKFLSYVMALVVLLLGIQRFTQPATPDAFYRPPVFWPATPGVLLREMAFVRGIPDNARAWRLLYSTSGWNGGAALASALVIVPKSAKGRIDNVVAWAHGTTGVMPGCAPSLLDAPLANFPGLDQAIERGWAIVATDYIGASSAGASPYLIGRSEGQAVLDSLRAALQLPGLRLGSRAVIWGHSQGGHAALWAGSLAPSYAPDIQVLGVAAIAPASDLPALVESNRHTVVGRILSAYILQAYRRAYADVALSSEPSWMEQQLASRCLAGKAALLSVAESALTGAALDPALAEPALQARLAENVPLQAQDAPVLIAQGASDELVKPAIQAGFVARICQPGQQVDYRLYPGLDHLAIVAPDSTLLPDLEQWTAQRFTGQVAAANCPAQTKT